MDSFEVNWEEPLAKCPLCSEAAVRPLQLLPVIPAWAVFSCAEPCVTPPWVWPTDFLAWTGFTSSWQTCRVTTASWHQLVFSSHCRAKGVRSLHYLVPWSCCSSPSPHQTAPSRCTLTRGSLAPIQPRIIRIILLPRKESFYLCDRQKLIDS